MSLKDIYEKMANMELPEGVDEQDREAKQLPGKLWILGKFPPGERGDSAGLNISKTQEEKMIYQLKFALHAIGGEEKLKQEAGPWAPLFARVTPHAGYDEKTREYDLTTISPKLMGLMNAVLSPGMVHGSKERWQNTLRLLLQKAQELGVEPDNGKYPSEACFLACMFSEIVNEKQPTLLFTVSLRRRKDKETGEVVKDAAGNAVFDASLGSFVDDTPEMREDKGIVEWTS